MSLLRKIEQLQEAIQRIESAISEHPVEPVNDGLPTPRQPGAAAAKTFMPDRQIFDIARFVLVPIALLTAAHHLIAFTFDLSPLFLLVVTLVLPLPFGFFAVCWGRRGFVFWTFAFLIASAAAVLLMNVDTAETLAVEESHVALFPANGAEWMENIKFVSSVLLSFLTGSLTALAYLRAYHPDHHAIVLTRDGVFDFIRRSMSLSSTETIEKAGKYVANIATLATAAGAVLLGIGRL